MRGLLIILMTISGIACNAQFYGTQPKIFISTGDAIVRIQPNQVVLSLGVETRGKELVVTKKENYLIMNKAIDYCRANNIPEKYIQTDYIKIYPAYKNYNSIIIDHYAVIQSISIIIEELDKYEGMLTDLLNLGINKVNNIEFRTTELKENRFKVRKMAIAAAKEKATFLSDEVGIELGQIVNIRESTENPVNSFSRSNYANISQNIVQNPQFGDDTGALSIGMISLKANVTLTYKVKEE